MNWPTTHAVLLFIQHAISFSGMLVILSGVLLALYQYLLYLVRPKQRTEDHKSPINSIRLGLGRTLVLGLEFIVAADLIGTTVTPDYYSVGIVACIVLIRTVLSYTLNRDLIALRKE